jgi:outer membrane protein
MRRILLFAAACCLPGCALFVWTDPTRPTLPLANALRAVRGGDSRPAAPSEEPAGPVRLTLEECVRCALMYNRGFQAARMEVQKARADVLVAQSLTLPRVDFAGRYVRLDKEVTADFGGMKLTLSPQDSYSAEFQVKQPLFLGGQAAYAVDAARIVSRIADLGVAGAAEGVAFAAAAAYFEVLFARENLKVTEKNVSVAEAHLADVRKRLDQGMASPFEELRARARVSLLKALAIQADNLLHGKELSLRRVLGLSLEEEIVIEGGLVFEPFEGNLARALEASRRDRLDLQAADAGIEALELQVSATRAELFPKIFGFFNAGWEKPSSRSFGGSGGAEYWNAGLSLSVPLIDGFATHGKLLKAYASLRQSRWRRADLVEEIFLQVRKALLNLNDAAKFVEAAQENLELAREGRRLAQVGYDNGVNTQLELLEADSGLTQAEYGYLQAVFGHVMAKAALFYSTGAFMRSFGYAADDAK